jgi:plastocyanin
MSAAGTEPRTRYRKPGAAIALLVAATALGLASAGLAKAATMTVQVGQQDGGMLAANQFNAATITLTAGDTAHWAWFSNPLGHTVVSFAQTGGVPDWQSPVLNGSGQSFDHTFTTPGVFTYYCSIHALRSDADPANIDASLALGKMVGKIVVSAPAAPSVGGVAALPNADVLAVKPAAGGANRWHGWLAAGIAAAAGMTIVAGYAAFRRVGIRRAGATNEDHD